MHSSMHFHSKKKKKKQISCLLICIFLKRKKIKNSYSNKFHALKHAFSFKKIHKVSCIHKCTLQKEQKIIFYAFKHTFSFKLKIQIQSKISRIIQKNQV